MHFSGSLHPQIFDQLMELFDCELEVIKGKKEQLPDGRIRFSIELEGYKAEIARDFVKALMNINSQEVKIEFMGLPISKN